MKGTNGQRRRRDGGNGNGEGISPQLQLKLLFEQNGCDGFECDNAKSRFAYPERMWRADFYWPAGGWPKHPGVVVEYEGGTFGRRKSRHTTGVGYASDCQKYNWAALHGLVVLRYTATDMQEPARIIQEVKVALNRADISTLRGLTDENKVSR